MPTPDPTLNIPPYWVRPPQILSGQPGMHRFLWDLHYAPVPGLQPQYPIAAVYRNTAPEATSPWAMPGQYTAILTVNGTSYAQQLMVRMDPRVKATTADLLAQFKLSRPLCGDWPTVASVGDRIKLGRAH